MAVYYKRMRRCQYLTTVAPSLITFRAPAHREVVQQNKMTASKTALFSATHQLPRSCAVPSARSSMAAENQTSALPDAPVLEDPNGVLTFHNEFFVYSILCRDSDDSVQLLVCAVITCFLAVNLRLVAYCWLAFIASYTGFCWWLVHHSVRDLFNGKGKEVTRGARGTAGSSICPGCARLCREM